MFVGALDLRLTHLYLAIRIQMFIPTWLSRKFFWNYHRNMTKVIINYEYDQKHIEQYLEWENRPKSNLKTEKIGL